MVIEYDSDYICCRFPSGGKIQDNQKDDPWHEIHIIADGLSSDPESERGSARAVDTAFKTFNGLRRANEGNPNLEEWVEAAINASINAANKAVYEINKVQDQQGEWLAGKIARTTIDLVYVHDDWLYAAHAGDGRIYLLDDNKKLVQLTRDHVSDGGLTCMLGCYEQMKGHEIIKRNIAGYSKILLATDGLYKLFGDEALAQMISGEGTAKYILSEITDAAKHKSKKDPFESRDDITGILIIRKGGGAK